MSKMRPATAKILCHSEGLGTPHVDLVRRRADEIALLNGRPAHNESDWQQAKHELHGSHGLDGEITDELGPCVMVSESDMLAVDTGHHVARLGMEDDGNMVEELWNEGLEEAQHERMLEATRAMDGEWREEEGEPRAATNGSHP